MAAAVVNRLQFRDPIDPALFARVEGEVLDDVRAIDGFQRVQVVQTGEREVYLVILADTAEPSTGSPPRLARRG